MSQYNMIMEMPESTVVAEYEPQTTRSGAYQVVNMVLTGFDATTLNTLWVDKNLKMHGLIQAYSRTNRILNSIKTFGNIVCDVV